MTEKQEAVTPKSIGSKEQSSRREFLKMISGLGLSLSTDLIHPKTYNEELASILKAPPTIMFHARLRQMNILNDLIQILQEQEYTFTTYQKYYKSIKIGHRIEKPVILTFDDITMVEGSSNFIFYAQHAIEIMKKLEVPGVFGVITEPIIKGQDGSLAHMTKQSYEFWREAKDWVSEGIVEFATHTQTHPNLDNPKLTQEDMDREIIGSSNLIEEMTGQKIRVLITPYGSGVTRDGVISPLILDACSRTEINFVSGIAVGCLAFPNIAKNERIVFAVGRIMPSSDSDRERILRDLQQNVEYITTKEN